MKNVSNIDIRALISLSQKKSEDAKHLAEEAYRDVARVLQEKSSKARKTVDDENKKSPS